MLKNFNHVAIAVKDLKKATEIYRDALNADVSKIFSYPEHGVKVVFVNLKNCKIELMEPIGENSPIKKFLERNSSGGIHHICIEVENIYEVRDNLKNKGFKILGSEEPKIGAHNKPVIFLHPKEFLGTLIELEQE